MNTHAQWRLDLARTLSTHLRRFAGIRAIAVGGSVARGYSDAYSDLELLLFWDQVPSLDVRHAIVVDLRAEFRYPAIDPGHDSALLIDGFPVDLWHSTVERGGGHAYGAARVQHRY
jgi:predicted nucleotidyltransferase